MNKPLFKREMEDELRNAAQHYPIVMLTGPRECGKTTLVKQLFPQKPYANLESLRIRELAESDPVGFLDRYPEGCILDEIQSAPHLLSEIQVRVDAQQKNGLYILTGSHQVDLRSAVAQSLAGRTALLHLLPLSLREFDALKNDLDTLLLMGGVPRVHYAHLDPVKNFSHYVQTYLERDLRQMVEIKNLQFFQKFLKLCAGRIGQLFNKESLANEVGVSSKTITHWIALLEASHLVFLLPPYFENFGKRAIKSPKLYFSDVGLAAFLLGIETKKQMERDPLRGALVENLVILELIKARWNRGLEHHLFFYRDAGQNEVDVLFQRGHQLTAIEIKSTKTFHSSLLKGLKRFEKLADARSVKPALIYAGEEEQQVQGISLLNFRNASCALS